MCYMKRIAILGSTGSIAGARWRSWMRTPIACRWSASRRGENADLLGGADGALPAAGSRRWLQTRRLDRLKQIGSAAGIEIGGRPRRPRRAWRRTPTSISSCAPRPAPTALEAVLAAIDARQDHRARQQGSAGDGRRHRDRRARAAAASPSCRSTASTTPFTSACTGATRRGDPAARF